MKLLTRRFLPFAGFVLLLVSASSPVRAGWQWLYPKPQGHGLHDVEFLTASKAIAVGEAGTIMVSHDAGLTWSATNKVNGVTTALYKIARIDDTTAIVVGGYGVVLKTSNAGVTWQSRPGGHSVEHRPGKQRALRGRGCHR